jgi:LacI family asc operon transcriptional repressor
VISPLRQFSAVQYTALISFRRNNNMTTMLEVAKRAGVSKATVSRVLSGNGYVSQETKDRVFQAIEESGYRPNLLARNLATKRPRPWGWW